MASASNNSKQVKVTLVRSVNGQLKNIAASVRGLGLRRPHQSVTVADTVENRGMIQAAGHLLRVESPPVEQN
jgi:large subunit ribosomal protein L30